MDQRTEGLKLQILEENTGGNLHDLGFGNDFKDKTLKVEATA